MPTDLQQLLEIVYLQQCVDEEKTAQENVVIARDYYEGDHAVPLSERQKEFLGFKEEESRFALNYCKGTVDAVTERMIVTALTSDDEAFAQWCWDVWADNRMDAKQGAVHHDAINDGETFVMVEWQADKPFPLLLPHPRYTDPEVNGDGYGCKAHYMEGDPNLPLEMVSKRWKETQLNARGKRETIRRMTLYYPDRIEKYIASKRNQAYREAGWEPYIEQDVDIDGKKVEKAWPIIRRHSDGTPVGIPFAVLCKPSRLPELWNAVPIQDYINKSALDLIATVDSTGFPVHLLYGWAATTDGKPPASDGSNYLKLFPGALVTVDTGTTKDGQKVTTEDLETGDIKKLQDALDSWILKLAQITSTPLSRFQMTKQIAAEGTLKQQEEPLLAKARLYTTQIGNGWEDVFYIARSLAKLNGQQVGDDASLLQTQWKPLAVRDEKVLMETLQLKAALGVPYETLWGEMGYDADQIAEMSAARAEQLAQTSNIGGALLESFERGGF